MKLEGFMKHLFSTATVVLAMLFLFNGCKQDGLPGPTTDGLNIFGCKVNGKAWIPDGKQAGKYPAERPITIELAHVKADTFNLSIYAASANDRVQLTLPKATMGVNLLKYPNIGSSAPFAVYYDDINFRHFYNFGTSSGKVVITRLDTLKGIVSGTFEFEGQEILQKQKVSISEGRFDIKLNGL